MLRTAPALPLSLFCRALTIAPLLCAPSVHAEQGLTFDLSEVEAPGLKLSVDPPRLVLGAGQSATVWIEVAGGPALANLRLLTNAGQLSTPQADGEGRFVATYTPPAQGPPQVALIAAVATLGGVPAVAHLALPLAGQGDLQLSARPGEEVSLRIGERQFGPVKADAQGFTEVHIEVDPGQRTALWGRERIDLGATDFNQILALSLQPAVAAGETADLRVFVIDRRGTPRKGARLKIKSAQGHVGRVSYLGDGSYGATFRAAKKLNGPARIGVWFKGKKASRAAFDIALRSPEVEPELASLNIETKETQASQPGAENVAASTAVNNSADATQGDSGGIEINLAEAAAAIESPEGEERWASEVKPAPAADDEGVPQEDHKTIRIQHPLPSTAPSVLALTLGVHAGFGSNIVALHAPELKLELGLRPELLLPGLMLQIEAGVRYFRAEQGIGEGVLQGEVIERQLLAMPLTLNLAYRVELIDALHLELAAGAGVAYALSSIGSETRNLLSLAVMAHLGLTYHLGPGELALRLRYSYGGLQKPYGGLLGLLGYRLELL